MSSMLARWVSVFVGAVLTGGIGLLLFGPNGLLVGFFEGLFVLLSALTVYVEVEARIEAIEDRIDTIETDLEQVQDD